VCEEQRGNAKDKNATEVIRIGRKRKHKRPVPPHARLAPESRLCFANSTIRIAFLHASP